MSPPTSASASPASRLKAWVRTVLRDASENKGRLGCGLIVLLIAVLVLRGVIRDWGGDRLPASVEAEVIRDHQNCQDDFPISVTEVRMPTCDLVTIRPVGAGVVPEAGRAEGITRAVCFYMDTESMFWGESGSWKHVMAWTLRTYSKVAVRQDGEWFVSPDEEQGDRARWAAYACPGEYQSSSAMVPR